MDEELVKVVAAVYITKKQHQRYFGVALHHRIESNSNQISDNPIGTSVVNETHPSYRIDLIDFIDNEHFSSFDAFLIQVGSCQLCLSDEYQDISKGDGKKIHNLLQNKNVDVVYQKKSQFLKKADTSMKIEKLCGKLTHSGTVADKDRPYAYQAMECLLHALDLMSFENMFGKYELMLGSLATFMRLDSAAADAVNLLPKPDHPSAYGSIYGVLNRCKTKMGSRLLERWLRQPLLDHVEIDCRLDIVVLLKSSISLRNQLTNEILRSIPDLETVVTRMQRKSAGLAEVYRLYIFSRTLPRIIANLSSIRIDATDEIQPMVDKIVAKFLIPFQSIQEKFSLYQQLVEHVLDFDQLPDLIVNAKHDVALSELREELDDIDKQSQVLLSQARDGWCSGVDVKLEDSTQHGLVFRSARADDERQIRANNANARIISILKNKGVHFTIPQLERLAAMRREINASYKEKQSNIAAKAVETALSYLPVAEIASSLVAELDVLNAFANVAATSANNYTRPKILPLGSGIIELKGARHPCVELMEDIAFIPNDYDLIRDKSNYQIITGPNMGGKSTYIRSIGSIMVMAQVGSFIPCEDGAVVSVIDSILARVGAGDAVQKGVSTFMAEMLEASVLLQIATPNSLLIVDELGRGTSTFDGFGIAWAISEYIVTNINCMTLFATHFHELTSLEKNHSGVVNKHVTAVMEKNELVMLYTVQLGPCSQSFGIHVAASAGFPKTVIAEAKRKAVQLEKKGVDVDVDALAVESKRQKLVDTITVFAKLHLPSIPVDRIKETLLPFVTEELST